MKYTNMKPSKRIILINQSAKNLTTKKKPKVLKKPRNIGNKKSVLLKLRTSFQRIGL